MHIFRYTKSKTSLPVQAGVPLYTRFDGFLTKPSEKRSYRPMKAFMDKDFMLQSPTAQHLYHDYAAGMPICDYH